MTNQTALRLIKKNRPKNLLDTSQLGLKLVHLGTGAFRSVYRIKGTDYVIKFLVENNYLDTEHSRLEVRNIKRLQKFRSLRPYLPKIYYYDRKTGVIIMEYYTRYSRRKAKRPNPTRTYGDTNWEIELIVNLIRQLTKVNFVDICERNLGIDKNNVVKFLDVGC
jgi:hypothetical protein